jgi:O-acetyl-ADP-ribose deacetylase (regulator of RNase III)
MNTIEIGNHRITFERGDITRLGRRVGAIVNAANESLLAGSGVCGAIHRSGGRWIQDECYQIGRCDTGSAVATTAGMLDADAVIHAVGPVWHGGAAGEDRLLASAYATSLAVAEGCGLTSIAFPSISTGIYGFPIERAAEIAVTAVAERLAGGSTVTEAAFVLFSDADYQVYSAAGERWSASR